MLHYLLFFHTSSNLNNQIKFSGRKESNTDNELLDNTNMDRPSPSMEQIGIRRNFCNKNALSESMETGHNTL